MGLGVRGILRKTLPTDLQVKCLQKVQAGELWFEKALTDSFLCARRVALTQREGQLVSLLSQGLKNKEIATTLMISEGTVKVYLSRLFQKVGVKDRFELALFGLKNLSTGQLPVGEKGARARARCPDSAPWSSTAPPSGTSRPRRSRHPSAPSSRANTESRHNGMAAAPSNERNALATGRRRFFLCLRARELGLGRTERATQRVGVANHDAQLSGRGARRSSQQRAPRQPRAFDSDAHYRAATW